MSYQKRNGYGRLLNNYTYCNRLTLVSSQMPFSICWSLKFRFAKLLLLQWLLVRICICIFASYPPYTSLVQAITLYGIILIASGSTHQILLPVVHPIFSSPFIYPNRSIHSSFVICHEFNSIYFLRWQMRAAVTSQIDLGRYSYWTKWHWIDNVMQNRIVVILLSFCLWISI